MRLLACMTMIRRFNSSAFLAALAGAALMAAAAPAAADGPADATVFDVKADKDFTRFRQPLATFLRERHARLPAKVCVLGEQHADGTKSAWVIWRAGHTMLLWDGGDAAMASSRRLLDLHDDVVATEADVNGSTYLVTRAWVAQQQARCNARGTAVILSRREVLAPQHAPNGEQQ